ncbi:MAG: hypothetical protein LAT77_08010 [Aliidiomarina sp.]|uniref:hypothetical protein n=1 Tax=Aliidiomarina sp. TaxID=1872439 RepID=UPI0025C1A68D|nr:hypothetical protein [Aliidiomarina sp.]MCH8501839.1 hypothetical protein [Aliidiomarina sp.]
MARQLLLLTLLSWLTLPSAAVTHESAWQTANGSGHWTMPQASVSVDVAPQVEQESDESDDPLASSAAVVGKPCADLTYALVLEPSLRCFRTQNIRAPPSFS